jgi:hypothetical protein
MDKRVIKDCQIERSVEMCFIDVEWTDGVKERIYQFYPPREDFTEKEFIGLTEEEATALILWRVYKYKAR